MKVFKKILVVILCVILSLCSLFLFAFGGLNLAKLAIYKDYYAVETEVCVNPGLEDGFVCQGITYVEDNGLVSQHDKILVSGYMADEVSASRIYVTDKENESKFIRVLNQDGSNFLGHLGGIAYHGNMIYVASENQVHMIPINNVFAASNGAPVAIHKTLDVSNDASFIFIDETHLYVGEFHDGGKYVTNHIYGDNHAIVERFALSDLTKPDRVYSIPNKVQGFVASPNGKIVLSTSYGLADSHYYVYEEENFTDSGEDFNGADVYFLGDPVQDLKGPAMAEGLDIMGDEVITLTESASNKYVFGKFFFADKIVSLDIL